MLLLSHSGTAVVQVGMVVQNARPPSKKALASQWHPQKDSATPPVATELTQNGQKHEQIIEIVGANGRRIPTLFVWIENTDGVVRLVTSTLGVK